MIKNNVFKAITSWQLVAKSIFIGLVLLLMSCEKESFLSDDYARSKELLPNKKEYVDDDLGTQALAKTIEGHYSSKLSMIYYDAERIKPLLYFTAGKHQVHCTTNANGSLHLSISKFHTNFMPLYVSVEMDVLLSEGVGDTDTEFLTKVPSKSVTNRFFIRFTPPYQACLGFPFLIH